MAQKMNDLYAGGYPHFDDLAFGTHPKPGEEGLLLRCSLDQILRLEELEELKIEAVEMSLDAINLTGVPDPECQIIAEACNTEYQEFRRSLFAEHPELLAPVSRSNFDVSSPGRINQKIHIPLMAASSAMRMLIDPNSGYYESVENLNDGGLDARFATEFALGGGVPVIPFDIPINAAVALIKELKRAHLKYRKPLFVHVNTTIGKIRELLMGQIDDAAAYVIDDNGNLIHMVSRYDVELDKDHKERTLVDTHKVSSLIDPGNPQHIERGTANISSAEAKQKMHDTHVHQLPIFDESGKVTHMFTEKQAALSEELNPFVVDGGLGAMFAVGIGPFNDMVERIDALMKAGATGFFLETAHAYRPDVIEKIAPDLEGIRKRYPNAVIGFGTVTEPEAVEVLSSYGFDIVKIGVGGGGHCSTFDVTGVGGLPYRSFRECSMRAAALGNIQVMTDGGINSTRRFNIAASDNGTALVQMGSWFGPTAESASIATWMEEHWRKILFGEASDHAEARRRKERQQEIDDKKAELFEKMKKRHENDRILGIHSEGKVTYKTIPNSAHGYVGGIMRSIKTALQSWGTYASAKNMKEGQERSRIMRISRTAT